MIANEILAALLALFGGANIFQFIFFRHTRTKSAAEAHSKVLDNRQKSLDIDQDERSGVMKQCDDMLAKVMAMQQQLQTCVIEVAELKAQCRAKDLEIEALRKDRDYWKSQYELLKDTLS